jgi:protein phosphatase
VHFEFGNAQHAGRRETQQDAFGFSDPADAAFVSHGGFLAVAADGMGGLACGDLASRAAVQAFLGAYAAKPPGEPIPAALARSLHAANQAVRAAQAAAGAEELGTTLVAAALASDGLYWISAGDSALYLLRGGELTRLNAPHVYGRQLDRAAAEGRISAAAAAADPQREALTSYLGLAELPEVDASVRALPLLAGDTVLLASDGLFKTVPEAEIAAVSGENLQDFCEQLIARTLDRHSATQDNVTVLAVRAGSPPAAAPPAPDDLGLLAPLPPRRGRPALRRLAFLLVLLSGLGGAGWTLWRNRDTRPGEIGARSSPPRDTSRLPEPFQPPPEPQPPAPPEEQQGGAAPPQPEPPPAGARR